MEEQRERRADLVAAAVWIVLGLVVMVLSWSMDRLERMNINPLTVPGLVPGLLGLALVVFGGALGLRAIGKKSETLADDPFAADPMPQDWSRMKRIAAVAAICVGYALGLLGTGVPFAFSTALFGFCLALLIEWMGRGGDQFRMMPAVVRSAATGGLITVLTIVVFQHFLLLRLP